MKKLFYLLFALPLLAFMASCDDDDKDLPNVDITIDYSGAVEVDGVVTLAQGEVLTINAINVTSVNTKKKAILGNVTYYIDGEPVGTTGVAPYSAEVSTDGLDVGAHSLAFFAQVLEEGKAPGFAVFSFPFMLTAPGENPGEGSGTVTPEVRIQDHQ